MTTTMRTMTTTMKIRETRPLWSRGLSRALVLAVCLALLVVATSQHAGADQSPRGGDPDQPRITVLGGSAVAAPLPGPVTEADPGAPSLQAEADTNSMSIYARVCPAGTDASGNLSAEQLGAVCTAPLSGLPSSSYAISVNGVGFGSVTIDASGKAFRDGLPPGTITIAQEARYPYKTPVAACLAYLNNEVDRPWTRYHVQEGWQTSIHDLLPNQDAACYVFHFAASPSYVYVETFACPVGFDAALAGPIELQQACPLAQPPIEFIMVGPGGAHHEYTAVGGVMFRYLDAGAFTLREVVPAGFEVPIVYCETSLRRADGAVVTMRQYDRQIMASADAIQSSIGTVGEAVECDWFNVPLPAPGDTPIIVPEGDADGEVTIQPVLDTPLLVPEDEEDGVVTILPVLDTPILVPEDEEDGVVTILPVPEPVDTPIIVPEGEEGEMTILPVPAEEEQP